MVNRNIITAICKIKGGMCFFYFFYFYERKDAFFKKKRVIEERTWIEVCDKREGQFDFSSLISSFTRMWAVSSARVSIA